jgi:hypothetical protein
MLSVAISSVPPTGAPSTLEMWLALAPVAVGVAYLVATRTYLAWQKRKDRLDKAVRAQARRVAAQEREQKSYRRLLIAQYSPRKRLLETSARSAPSADEASAPVTRAEVVSMERAAADLSWMGVLLLMEAALVIFVVLHHFGEVTDHFVFLLRDGKSTTETLVLLVIRTAAYGTVTSTAIYALVRFAGACFDQATRFRKRGHSAHVLNFVLTEYDDNIKAETVTLKDALEVFKAWNDNVESAFTGAKLIKDKQETVSGGVSPGGGATFNYGAPVADLATKVAKSGKSSE